jgi:hypothetical protein
MKLKVVIVDFELSPRAKRLALAIGIPAFILGVATVAYANVPNVFSSGEVLTAAALNADFAYHDTEIAALQTDIQTLQSTLSTLQSSATATQSALATLQSSAFTTLIPSNLNNTDPATDSWQPFGTQCNAAVHSSTTNASEAVIVACTLAANRKCLALGYPFGIYIGEDPGNDTTSILCLDN